MGVAQHWSYELADGSVGIITSLPIDCIMAEKRKLSPESDGISYTSFVMHSALVRRARKTGVDISAYEHWREHELMDYDVISKEDFAGDVDPNFPEKKAEDAVDPFLGISLPEQKSTNLVF